MMPTAARRSREQARKARLDAQAKYDAAGSGRRLSGWNPPASGPSRATEGQPKVRDRANDAARNDWVGASTAQKWTTALVGVGVTPRWDDESITEHWEDHAKVCDADGVCNAYALQALGVRTWFIGGEAFLRRRSRPTSLGLPAPVQFQLYESAQLPLFDADTWRGMPPSHDIRQGIERDIYGTRQAYWFHAQHPGELWSKGAPTPDQLVRVPADQVSHIFEPKRPGQLRGVSELAQILVRARASADFEDAVLDRQKLGNLFLAFIRRTMPPVDSVDFDDLTGLPKFYDKDRNPLVGMQPGMIQDLLPGEDVQFANPPEAGTTFSEYMRSTHLGTASGTGLPYELMSGDIANVSDRTLRVVINEFRRFAEQRQWHVVIPKIVDPMVRWWADASLLSGAISTRKFAAAAKPEYAPHGWEYIHPVQDIEGKVKAIEAGLTSVSAEVSKRGDDPKKVRQQRADDQAADKALGIEPPRKSAPAAPAPAPDPNALLTRDLLVAVTGALALRPEPVALVTDESPLEHFVRSLSDQTAAVTALASAVVASSAKPTVVNVQPAEVTVNNNVPVPAVSVSNEVNVPEGAPPTVHVTNDVQPAAVSVTVDLPDRTSETTLVRDSEGNLERSITIEKTLQ